VVPLFGALMVAAGTLGTVGAMAGRPQGLMITLAAFLAILTTAFLKVVVKTDAMRLNTVAGTLAVACVYDVARALALVTRAPHHRKVAR
jgi:hypothetical protein